MDASSTGTNSPQGSHLPPNIMQKAGHKQEMCEHVLRPAETGRPFVLTGLTSW